MKEILSVDDLHHYLDENGLSGISATSSHKFVVTYYDNKDDAEITTVLVHSPLAAVRGLKTVCDQAKLPFNDVDVVLRFGFSDDKYTSLNAYLSPWLYYSKPKEV